MRKSLVLACGLVCCARLAHAESQVTFYGIVDEFVQYDNTGKGYTAAVQSNGQWASRWGLRGTEDIGAGNRVNFTLENGFNPNNGSMSDSTSLFNRQAWVGVSGYWGEVRMGRQNSPLFINEGRADAFAAVTQASGINNFSEYTIRTSNTVSYLSPVYGGLQVAVYVGLGTSGGFRQPGSSYQYSITYDKGPISAFYAAQGVWSTTDVNDRSAFGGLSYQIGPATLYLGYHSVDWSDVSAKYRVYSVSGKWAFSPFQSLSIGGAYLADRTSRNNDARQISALYNYYLSKRTNIYAAMSFLQNRNTASHTLAGAATAGPALAYPGADARGVQLGIVHRF